MDNEPLVSVVTPVYNGEPFISECIESVLKQSYKNFEYIIINNCSKDTTLATARKYEQRDPRIRVYDNTEFVGVIENHNIAFRRISPKSKYCKVVSGDDWLFPHALAELVSVAEANSSVGIVGSYQLSGGGTDWRQWRVRWAEIPYPSTVVTGREICRTQLLGGPYVFGTPTSLLYRADLVRNGDKFYPNPTAEGDTSACYKSLQNADFGFVHKVLSYERVHEVRQTTTSQLRNAYLSSTLSDLTAYGSFYMTEAERQKRTQELLDEYYKFLAVGAVNFRKADFWRYHKTRLKELGFPLKSGKLSFAILAKVVDLLCNPKSSIEKALKHVPNG